MVVVEERLIPKGRPSPVDSTRTDMLWGKNVTASQTRRSLLKCSTVTTGEKCSLRPEKIHTFVSPQGFGDFFASLEGFLC